MYVCMYVCIRPKVILRLTFISEFYRLTELIDTGTSNLKYVGLDLYRVAKLK